MSERGDGSMNSSVYIVVGHVHVDYEHSNTWMVSAYTGRAMAESHAIDAANEARSVIAILEERRGRYYAGKLKRNPSIPPNKFDSDFCNQCEGQVPTYIVEELILRCEREKL